MNTETVVTVQVDCHAYPWHEVDETGEYPECGPENLVRLAETHGVLIQFLPDHEWAGWAWWYEITGPVDHIVGLLTEEYCGSEPEARELVEGLLGLNG